MRQIYLQKNHGWRDAYNSLRGLNLSRLVALQEAGERGQYADLQWLYYYMERSDAMIHSVIQRRRAALLSLDWDIRIVSLAQHDPRAQQQADFLRMVYDNIANFREAVSFLFSGFFRGFAHLEKHWADNGLIERLVQAMPQLLMQGNGNQLAEPSIEYEIDPGPSKQLEKALELLNDVHSPKYSKKLKDAVELIACAKGWYDSNVLRERGVCDAATEC
jgi:hypothetical protein